MRTVLNAINDIPHAEERPQGASRSTHGFAAADLFCVDRFPNSLFRGGNDKWLVILGSFFDQILSK
jgi:hypothetical protein